MSHGVSPVSLKDVPTIVTAEPFRLPSLWRSVAFGLIALGMFGFAREILGGGDPTHAWVAFHINVLYWFFVAVASTGFSAVLHICNSQWSRPIRRIFESASTFLFYCPLLLLILYVFRGYEHLFVWSHEAIAGKENWLEPNFVYFRDLAAMIVLILLGRRVVFYSLRRDIGAIRSGLTGVSKEKSARWEHKDYDRFVSDWGSNGKEEIQATHDRMGRLSPVFVMAYAVAMSLIAFDQIMSVDPHWYSTMFGGFVFMASVYSAVAWCAIFVGVTRWVHPLFLAKIERRTLHDLGKLLFGFGIFWAYLFWSHYLPIWYGNMPEETAWIILRLREEPWHSFAWIVFGMCFIVPFLLGLSRDVKQVPQLLLCTGIIVACGVWLENYLLFTPTLYPHAVPFGFVEVSITLGFFGGYLLSAASFLEKAPLMPFGDLYIQKASSH